MYSWNFSLENAVDNVTFLNLAMVIWLTVSKLEVNAIGCQTVLFYCSSIALSPNLDASYVTLIGRFLLKIS